MSNFIHDIDGKFNEALNEAGYDLYAIGQEPTDEQMNKLLFIQKVQAYKHIRTIKSCAVFVTALIALSVFVSVILPLLM